MGTPRRRRKGPQLATTPHNATAVGEALAAVEAALATAAAAIEAAYAAVHDDRRDFARRILEAQQARRDAELELEEDRERAAAYIARLWSLIATLLGMVATCPEASLRIVREAQEAPPGTDDVQGPGAEPA